MKKYLLLSMAVISQLFIGCSEDDFENDLENGDPTGKGYDVRYEASVSDTINYLLRVGYVNQNGSVVQEDVKRPFVYNMTGKKRGDYLYISVASHLKPHGTNTNNKVSCQLYVNDKLTKEDSGEAAAVVNQVLE